MNAVDYFSQKMTGLAHEAERRVARPAIPTPESVKTIHISAICGKAMAPLAGLLTAKGYHVTGSDNTYAAPMSDVLTELGIKETSFCAENVEGADLIIVGNALGPTNIEAETARRLGKPYISVAEALSHFIMGDQDPIVVAGTHGKTTTTGLLVKIFLDAGVDPSFLVGGVVQGENTAYMANPGQSFIIEGDEYDTAYFDKRPKFLHYNAKHLIVTSMELDHTDIYRDEEDYFTAFRYLVEQMPEKGTVFLCADNDAIKLKPYCSAKVITYGFSNNADLQVSTLESKNALQSLQFTLNGEQICTFETPLTGVYNCLNIAAALGVSLENGLSLESLKATILKFTGMKKRQELLANAPEKGIELIDDFAHHPTAVEATLSGMRKRYPKDQHRIVAIFEPRSNSSRRKSFEDNYPAAFKDADLAILKIPPFRHNDNIDDFMDAPKVVETINRLGVPAVLLESNEKILAHLNQYVQPNDILITMSNGHFDHIQQDIITELGLNAVS